MLSRGLFIILSIAFSSTLSANSNLELMMLNAQPLKYSIERDGVLDFKHLTQLAFRSAGFVESVVLDEGEYFDKGQEIARLDTTDLLSNLKSAQASHEKALGDLRRARSLYKQKTVSEDFLELAIRDERNTKSALEIARYDLDNAVIIAPFDGAVVARLVQPGEYLAPGQALYSVAALQDNMVVKLNLTQQQRRLLSTGDTGQVSLLNDSAQQSLSLKAFISKIAVRAHPETGLYVTELSLEQATVAAFAGQWASVKLERETDTDVYALPFSAISAMKNSQVEFYQLEQGEPVITIAQPLYFDQNAVYVAAKAPQIEVVAHGWHLLQSAAKR